MTTTGTRILRGALALSLAMGLGACATVDTATRNAPATTTTLAAPAADPEALASALRVTDIRVQVPRELRVSEANRYYPSGDIVWREDPIGDRHQQVSAIVHKGLSMGAAQLEGEVPVVLDVIVTRFHALTEKARYTVGGVHAIQFDLTVTHAQTGEVIMPRHPIKADFDALGGTAAVRAEANGITQKVRITQHLSKVIVEELSRPEGYTEQFTGIIGALNQI